MLSDSRDVDKFGIVLESSKAVEYLERTVEPIFETAYRIAGGDESETIERIDRAADEVEEALSTVHHHVKSRRLRGAVKRLAADVFQLLNQFPGIKDDIFGEDD